MTDNERNCPECDGPMGFCPDCFSGGCLTENPDGTENIDCCGYAECECNRGYVQDNGEEE